jgi:hypothetical protein
VVKSVLNGVGNSDTWDMLVARTEELPEDLNELFKSMLKRRREDWLGYDALSAIYFGIMFHEKLYWGCSLLLMTIIVDSELRHRLLATGQIGDSKQLLQQCISTRTRIYAQSAGLLEILDTPAEIKTLEATADSQVAFIHRSAHDFMVDQTDFSNAWWRACNRKRYL